MTDPFEPALIDVPSKVEISKNPPCDIAHAVGRLSIAMAQLEYVMRMWIKTMLGSDFHGAMITNYLMGFERLTEIAESLVIQRSDGKELITAFRNLSDVSRTLAQKRNDYIHGLYTTDDLGMPIIVTIKRNKKKGLVSKAIRPDVELVTRLTQAIIEKTEALEMLRHRVKVRPRQQTEPEVFAP